MFFCVWNFLYLFMTDSATGNLFLFLAVLIALFGPTLVKRRRVARKTKMVREIMISSLDKLKLLIVRIQTKGPNQTRKKETDIFNINETSLSEIGGFGFLFDDLLLKNMDDINLSEYPATINFFLNYKINIETVKQRQQKKGAGYLTVGTINNLLKFLDECFVEMKGT